MIFSHKRPAKTVTNMHYVNLTRAFAGRTQRVLGQAHGWGHSVSQTQFLVIFGATKTYCKSLVLY